MAYVTVEADVELDDFSTSEIIKHLIYLIRNKRIEAADLKKLKEAIAVSNSSEAHVTLADVQRLEVFNEYGSLYSPLELENRLRP